MTTAVIPAFSIYVDSPPNSPPKPRLTRTSTTLGIITSTPSTSSITARPMLRVRSASCTNTPTSPFSICSDKENTHPVTGERASSVGPSGKAQKRKTGVLETKLYDPPAAKKLKDGKTSKTSKTSSSSTTLSKSKLTTSSSSSTKTSSKRRAASVPLPDSENASQDDATPSQPKKKMAKRTLSSRKINSLPVLEEEDDTEEFAAAMALPTSSTAAAIAQAEIDSRCYDLTVSPLADVSDAYTTSPVDQLMPLPVVHRPSTRKSKAKAQETLGRGMPSSSTASATSSPARRAMIRSHSMPVTFSSLSTPMELPHLSWASSTSTLVSSSSLDTLADADAHAHLVTSPVDFKDLMSAFEDVDQPVNNGAYAAFNSSFDSPEKAFDAFSFGGMAGVDRIPAPFGAETSFGGFS